MTASESTIHRRAIEAINWGMPAVNFDLMQQAGGSAGAKPNQIKLYPLSQAANPPATAFVDVIDVVYDATIPYDVRFFDSLNRVVQIESWLTRDKVIIDMLKSIGIEKGTPFNPESADTGHPERGRAGRQGLARCALRRRLSALL